MLKALVFIYCAAIMVKSENDRGKRVFERRQPKLFSFNVADEDVSIDLQFSIPFLKLPVKKTMDSAYGMIGLPSININPAALALGGAVVLGTTVVLPFFAKQVEASPLRRITVLVR
ncbi:unnamed protein product [Arctia plantaginis]|uniref:Uncharacterized protein n=1 Tax=Arctia plantaginis TaxID=874455 RepID=A0A8S1AS15_ARCPL|nr:unnamed protein product [Arctia plantaginis]